MLKFAMLQHLTLAIFKYDNEYAQPDKFDQRGAFSSYT